MADFLTEAQWRQYEEKGYLKLGKLLTDEELQALQQRIDAIMLGEAKLNYDLIMMQLDSISGNYGGAGPQTKGHKGATLDYRKIQELEFDPLFLQYMQRPVFREVCARVYGADASISLFRAMFMNKPANKGTFLPWHQDRWKHLDRDPLLTIYTALDPATSENGCVQVIEGSHRWGLLNPEHGSGFLTEEQANEAAQKNPVVLMELEAGEVALLHNWLLHSSDVNRSGQSRRAFSVCVMDAETRRKESGEIASESVLFGEGALTPQGVAALHG